MQSGTDSIGRKKYFCKNILDALFSTVGTERVLAGSGRQVHGNGSVSRRWVVYMSQEGRQTDGGREGSVEKLVWWIFESILGTKMGTAVTKTSIFGSKTLQWIVIWRWFVSLLMKEKMQHVFGFLEAWSDAREAEKMAGRTTFRLFGNKWVEYLVPRLRLRRIFE
jgi:hypothetical protein